MKNPLINIEGLHFGYKKDEEVLKDINFSAGENEAVGIIGANGVGKSTLLKLLVGLNLNFTGYISVEGINLEKKNLKSIRGKIGYVFQDADNQLFMTTVGADVAFAPLNYGLAKSEAEKRVDEALEKTHIQHLKNKNIYELSGGEKKLASIATILSMVPSIILMDEPSIALDPKNRHNLIHILNEIDSLKIIASHDLDFIWDTCTKIVLMNRGKIVATDTPDKILRDRTLLEQNGLELPLSLTSR